MQCDESTVFRKKSQKLIDIYTFDKLLESINKERLSEQITTAEQIEEQKKILGVLQKENALICQPQQNLSVYIDKMIFID